MQWRKIKLKIKIFKFCALTDTKLWADGGSNIYITTPIIWGKKWFLLFIFLVDFSLSAYRWIFNLNHKNMVLLQLFTTRSWVVHTLKNRIRGLGKYTNKWRLHLHVLKMSALLHKIWVWISNIPQLLLLCAEYWLSQQHAGDQSQPADYHP